MTRGLSIPALLGVLLLAWALFAPREVLLPPATEPEAPGAPIPDGYAVDVTAVEFNDQGEIVARTEAARIERFNGGERTELLQPRRSAHGAQENWIATADRGLLRERAGTLELRGDVLLRYSDRDARFASEAMLINFDARTARSLAPVRAWDARGETRAEHLFVNLDSQFAALRGNVITRHAAID